MACEMEKIAEGCATSSEVATDEESVSHFKAGDMSSKDHIVKDKATLSAASAIIESNGIQKDRGQSLEAGSLDNGHKSTADGSKLGGGECQKETLEGNTNRSKEDEDGLRAEMVGDVAVSDQAEEKPGKEELASATEEEGVPQPETSCADSVDSLSTEISKLSVRKDKAEGCGDGSMEALEAGVRSLDISASCDEKQHTTGVGGEKKEESSCHGNHLNPRAPVGCIPTAFGYGNEPVVTPMDEILARLSKSQGGHPSVETSWRGCPDLGPIRSPSQQCPPGGYGGGNKRQLQDDDHVQMFRCQRPEPVENADGSGDSSGDYNGDGAAYPGVLPPGGGSGYLAGRPPPTTTTLVTTTPNMPTGGIVTVTHMSPPPPFGYAPSGVPTGICGATGTQAVARFKPDCDFNAGGGGPSFGGFRGVLPPATYERQTSSENVSMGFESMLNDTTQPLHHFGPDPALSLHPLGPDPDPPATLPDLTDELPSDLEGGFDGLLDQILAQTQDSDSPAPSPASSDASHNMSVVSPHGPDVSLVTPAASPCDSDVSQGTSAPSPFDSDVSQGTPAVSPFGSDVSQGTSVAYPLCSDVSQYATSPVGSDVNGDFVPSPGNPVTWFPMAVHQEQGPSYLAPLQEQLSPTGASKEECIHNIVSYLKGGSPPAGTGGSMRDPGRDRILSESDAASPSLGSPGSVAEDTGLGSPGSDATVPSVANLMVSDGTHRHCLTPPYSPVPTPTMPTPAPIPPKSQPTAPPAQVPPEPSAAKIPSRSRGQDATPPTKLRPIRPKPTGSMVTHGSQVVQSVPDGITPITLIVLPTQPSVHVVPAPPLMAPRPEPVSDVSEEQKIAHGKVFKLTREQIYYRDEEDGDSLLVIAMDISYPLFKALLARLRRQDILGDFINQKNKLGHTPVYIALLQNKSLCIRDLVAHGADVNIQVPRKRGLDVEYRSPLHVGASFGHTRLDALRALLEAPTKKIDDQNSNYETPLHCAIRSHGREELRREEDGKATKLRIDCSDTVRLLVEHGASLKAKTNSGRTPLHVAVEKADVDFMRFVLKLAPLGEREEALNMADGSGETPMQLASRLKIPSGRDPGIRKGLMDVLEEFGALKKKRHNGGNKSGRGRGAWPSTVPGAARQTPVFQPQTSPNPPPGTFRVAMTTASMGTAPQLQQQTPGFLHITVPQQIPSSMLPVAVATQPRLSPGSMGMMCAPVTVTLTQPVITGSRPVTTIGFPVTLASQSQPSSVPISRVINSQSQPSSVPISRVINSQLQPSSVPISRVIKSQSQPTSVSMRGLACSQSQAAVQDPSMRGGVNTQSQMSSYSLGGAANSQSQSRAYATQAVFSSQSQSPAHATQAVFSSQSQSPAHATQAVFSSQSQSPGHAKQNVFNSQSQSTADATQDIFNSQSQFPAHATQAVFSSQAQSPAHATQAVFNSQSQSPAHATQAVFSSQAQSPAHATQAVFNSQSQSPAHATQAVFNSQSQSPAHATQAVFSSQAQSPAHATQAVFNSQSQSPAHATQAVFNSQSQSPAHATQAVFNSQSQSPAHATQAVFNSQSQFPAHATQAVFSSQAQSPGHAKQNVFNSQSQSTADATQDIFNSQLQQQAAVYSMGETFFGQSQPSSFPPAGAPYVTTSQPGLRTIYAAPSDCGVRSNCHNPQIPQFQGVTGPSYY